MSKFKITKKISLSVLGEGHENDYLIFTPLTYKDAKQLEKLGNADTSTADAGAEAVTEVMGFIKKRFISGKVTDEDSKEQVTLTADDIDDLPVSIMQHIMAEMAGAKSEDFTQR